MPRSSDDLSSDTSSVFRLPIARRSLSAMMTLECTYTACSCCRESGRDTRLNTPTRSGAVACTASRFARITCFDIAGICDGHSHLGPIATSEDPPRWILASEVVDPAASVQHWRASWWQEAHWPVQPLHWSLSLPAVTVFGAVQQQLHPPHYHSNTRIDAPCSCDGTLAFRSVARSEDPPQRILACWYGGVSEGANTAM